jgi:hypothetical protein
MRLCSVSPSERGLVGQIVARLLNCRLKNSSVSLIIRSLIFANSFSHMALLLVLAPLGAGSIGSLTIEYAGHVVLVGSPENFQPQPPVS